MFENSLKEIKQKMFKLKHLEQYYVSRQIKKKTFVDGMGLSNYT